MNNLRTTDEIIFLDFDPVAMHHVLNFLQIPEYKIPIKYVYLFNFLTIALHQTNIEKKESVTCVSCGTIFRINDNDPNRGDLARCDYCITVFCDYIGCGKTSHDEFYHVNNIVTTCIAKRCNILTLNKFCNYHTQEWTVSKYNTEIIIENP